MTTSSVSCLLQTPLTNLESPDPRKRSEAQQNIKNCILHSLELVTQSLLRSPQELGEKVHAFKKHPDNDETTDALTRVFFNHANPIQQHSFIFSYTRQETFSFLEFLLTLPKDLTSLTLANFNKLDDTQIEDISKKCPSLVNLTLPLCSDITDTGIKSLAKNCKNLETIDLVDFWNITDASITALDENCPNLRKLDIRGCSKITVESIEAIRESHPGIDIRAGL